VFRELKDPANDHLVKLVQTARSMGSSEAKAIASDAMCRRLSERGKCRHPQHARPSMSGFGINVNALMKTCGWTANASSRDEKSNFDSMSWVAGLVLIG
jgi:hypothetical protein